MGVSDKIRVAKKICGEIKITLKEVAYIGDDIIDILLLEAVGLSATSSNAMDYVKEQILV